MNGKKGKEKVQEVSRTIIYSWARYTISTLTQIGNNHCGPFEVRLEVFDKLKAVWRKSKSLQETETVVKFMGADIKN